MALERVERDQDLTYEVHSLFCFLMLLSMLFVGSYYSANLFSDSTIIPCCWRISGYLLIVEWILWMMLQDATELVYFWILSRKLYSRVFDQGCVTVKCVATCDAGSHLAVWRDGPA